MWLQVKGGLQQGTWPGQHLGVVVLDDGEDGGVEAADVGGAIHDV